MDVTFLYTNIPHDDGIAACRNMGTTNSSRTSDRMFSGDAYTGSKKQQFYFRQKPLSSNKWDSYGNQNGTLLCQHFYGGPRRTITPLVT
jgi:hypothetical protein